jgi:group II intron reverse transcriptase/maturase
MQSAETILTVIRERGTRGLPLERVYRLLFNPDLYLRAYARLYPNKGAMTKGSTPETVDGMSLRKIEKLIDDVRHERHRWTPVRRVHIPKPNGKMRPLGIPSWSDKLLQEVMRSILEAYYEPQFSNHSHGFRPNHGCHTALQDIQQNWKGTRWFIEGDIKQYFDTIDHKTLIEILRKDIHDERVIRLIKELLAAGYMEDWKYNKTLSGAPQGGVISPLLSNIYLNTFDQWVEETLIPANTRGTKRKYNPAYFQISKKLYRMKQRGKTKGAKELIKQRRKLPSVDPNDEGYRRLRYVRYADDFLLGYAGTKSEAEEIKRIIKEWLRDNLKLDLSDEKTLITHAATQRARFLGYEIAVGHSEETLDTHGRRTINGYIGLYVPAKVVEAKCSRYKKDGKAIHRPELLTNTDYSIVAEYQQEYRGIVQYYLHAYNVNWLHKLHWVMETSLLKTLATKHKTTVMAVMRRYKTDIQTPEGKTLKGLVVRVEREGKPPLVAQFGGIPLTRQPFATLDDQPYVDKGGRTELLQRLLADECENCGSHENIEVHHVRKLADLIKRGRKEKPQWVKEMIARCRKTLVLCRNCHMDLHAGRLQWQKKSE